MENKFEIYIKNNFDAEVNEICSGYENRPLDSYDRLFALYLLDSKSSFCNYNAKFEFKNNKNQNLYDLLSDEEKELFDYESDLAYENYEREGISENTALLNMLNVINKGRQAVLDDSYEDGGWFGSC